MLRNTGASPAWSAAIVAALPVARAAGLVVGQG